MGDDFYWERVFAETFVDFGKCLCMRVYFSPFFFHFDACSIVINSVRFMKH